MAAISGVVLAGGQSRRLGTDKALVQVGALPVIERVLAVLRDLTDDLLIVANNSRYGGLGARVVADAWPNAGALGGVYTGVAAARYERALVLACDMPFPNPGLLRYIAALSAHYQVVMPNLDGLLEPLHAAYARSTLGPMQAVLQVGGRRIREFLPQVGVRYVSRAELELFDPEHRSLLNINTQADLQLARSLAEPGAGIGGCGRGLTPHG